MPTVGGGGRTFASGSSCGPTSGLADPAVDAPLG